MQPGQIEQNKQKDRFSKMLAIVSEFITGSVKEFEKSGDTTAKSALSSVQSRLAAMDSKVNSASAIISQDDVRQLAQLYNDAVVAHNAHVPAEKAYELPASFRAVLASAQSSSEPKVAILTSVDASAVGPVSNTASVASPSQSIEDKIKYPFSVAQSLGFTDIEGTLERAIAYMNEKQGTDYYYERGAGSIRRQSDDSLITSDHTAALNNVLMNESDGGFVLSGSTVQRPNAVVSDDASASLAIASDTSKQKEFEKWMASETDRMKAEDKKYADWIGGMNDADKAAAIAFVEAQNAADAAKNTPEKKAEFNKWMASQTPEQRAESIKFVEWMNSQTPEQQKAAAEYIATQVQIDTTPASLPSASRTPEQQQEDFDKWIASETERMQTESKEYADWIGGMNDADKAAAIAYVEAQNAADAAKNTPEKKEEFEKWAATQTPEQLEDFKKYAAWIDGGGGEVVSQPSSQSTTVGSRAGSNTNRYSEKIQNEINEITNSNVLGLAPDSPGHYAPGVGDQIQSQRDGLRFDPVRDSATVDQIIQNTNGLRYTPLRSKAEASMSTQSMGDAIQTGITAASGSTPTKTVPIYDTVSEAEMHDIKMQHRVGTADYFAAVRDAEREAATRIVGYQSVPDTSNTNKVTIGKAVSKVSKTTDSVPSGSSFDAQADDRGSSLSPGQRVDRMIDYSAGAGNVQRETARLTKNVPTGSSFDGAGTGSASNSTQSPATQRPTVEQVMEREAREINIQANKGYDPLMSRVDTSQVTPYPAIPKPPTTDSAIASPTQDFVTREKKSTSVTADTIERQIAANKASAAAGFAAGKSSGTPQPQNPATIVQSEIEKAKATQNTTTSQVPSGSSFDKPVSSTPAAQAAKPSNVSGSADTIERQIAANKASAAAGFAAGKSSGTPQPQTAASNTPDSLTGVRLDNLNSASPQGTTVVKAKETTAPVVAGPPKPVYDPQNDAAAIAQAAAVRKAEEERAAAAKVDADNRARLQQEELNRQRAVAEAAERDFQVWYSDPANKAFYDWQNGGSQAVAAAAPKLPTYAGSAASTANAATTAARGGYDTLTGSATPIPTVQPTRAGQGSYL